MMQSSIAGMDRTDARSSQYYTGTLRSGPQSIFQAPSVVRPDRTEVTLAALGIIDQAVRGLMHLPMLRVAPQMPRSLLFDIFQIYRQFSRHDGRLLSQVRLLGQAGGCVAQLSREWKDVLGRPAPVTRTHKATRYYTIASLAAASIVIPWLLLRKRPNYVKSSRH